MILFWGDHAENYAHGYGPMSSRQLGTQHCSSLLYPTICEFKSVIYELRMEGSDAPVVWVEDWQWRDRSSRIGVKSNFEKTKINSRMADQRGYSILMFF